MLLTEEYYLLEHIIY